MKNKLPKINFTNVCQHFKIMGYKPSKMTDSVLNTYNISVPIEIEEVTIKYFILGPIGRGKQGDVYKCLGLEDDKIYAIKYMQANTAKRELACLERLQGLSGILCLKDKYIDEKFNQACIITDFIEGCVLLDYAKKTSKNINFKRSKIISKNILNAIISCHDHGVAHRDIKLENIMLMDNDEIILIDFGFSTLFQKNNLYVSNNPGTLAYACPELLSSSKNIHLTKADTWSFGVIMYILLTGYYPFGGSDKPSNRIRISSYKWDQSRIIDKHALSILNSIFVPQNERITIDELKYNTWFDT